MKTVRNTVIGKDEKVALIIHCYIPLTVPERDNGEVTEKQIIDNRWVQRLRYIGQLQAARWVFPGAEHSRFGHSAGANVAITLGEGKKK